MLEEFCVQALADLEGRGLRRGLLTLGGPPGPWLEHGGRRVLVLGSNDYLGLSAHPEVREAAAWAAREWGSGAGASRLTAGNRPWHAELEEALAAHKGAADAVLFGSGYLANVGAIPALVGPGDLICSDELNHASIIDGCRLSRAEVRVFRHADPASLEHVLAAERGGFRHCLIVTDGLFSMDGDLAPLPQLAGLAGRFGAWLMVDDAHATGVLGETGAGTLEHFGLAGRASGEAADGRGAGLVQMGTLSKALAAEGGFVAGSRPLAEFLRNRARSFIFSTAPSPAVTAAALAALRLAQAGAGGDLRRRLQANAVRLREGLAALGYRCRLPGTTGVELAGSPIIPVVIGEETQAVRLAADLLCRGVYAPAIRPPSVPPGTARLRVTVTAAHTGDDVGFALAAFAAAREEVDL